MKVEFRSLFFALVLPASALVACGGDEQPTVAAAPWDYLPKAPSVNQPVAETHVVVETAKPIVEVPTAPTKKLSAVEEQIELARKYIASNERGKAISAANKAIKLAPNSSQAWNTKGRAELNAKNYDNAIEAFTQAVELNKDNAFAWNNLGYTELLLKRYEDAAAHLIEATTKQDATGYMFNNLGTALEHLDQLDDARMAYEAGGKLGSKEAASSRKRLEGVDSIEVVASKPSEVQTYDISEEMPEPDGSTLEEPDDTELAPDDNATH